MLGFFAPPSFFSSSTPRPVAASALPPIASVSRSDISLRERSVAGRPVAPRRDLLRVRSAHFTSAAAGAEHDAASERNLLAGEPIGVAAAVSALVAVANQPRYTIQLRHGLEDLGANESLPGTRSFTS